MHGVYDRSQWFTMKELALLDKKLMGSTGIFAGLTGR